VLLAERIRWLEPWAATRRYVVDELRSSSLMRRRGHERKRSVLVAGAVNLEALPPLLDELCQGAPCLVEQR